MGGQIQNMVKLIGGLLPQCTDGNRTNIGNGQTSFVWQSSLLVNEYTHVNQSMMQGVAHVGLTAKQMIIYYDVPNEPGIELRSIESSND